MACSPRDQLKQATAGAHAGLEELVGDLASRSAYARYLRGMHAFRTSVERWLSSTPTFDTDWRPTRLASALTQDLADLAQAPLNPPPPFAHGMRDEGFVLGVHYVLEGSALGARILCKQVESLGLGQAHGARHLWAQAASLEPWRAFVALLQDRDARELDGMVAGANATFAAASTAMRKAAHG